MTGVLRAHVRAPAALSSIFSPKVLDGDKPRVNPDLLGACGGGFSITPGVETWVSILPEGDGVHVNVNDYYTSFPPTSTAARLVMKTLNLSGEAYIRHRVYVPIATGFGTSASAALSTILAISHAAGKPVTLNQAIRLTHYVELECRTGLNSEAGFGHAGLVLVRHEGAPPHSIVDEIPIPHDCRLVSVVAGPIETSKALAETEKIKHIEKVGDIYMEKILAEPTPENFLTHARRFAVEAGLADRAVMEIFEAMKDLPVIGYAQNMLGRAVHALVYEDYIQQVLEALRRRFTSYNIFVSNPSATVSLKTF
ncbi:hypothetical protein HRbin01_00822 [archaeon HR01]|nr:hypothetical protein HRbin01_00822 [archaeon HR01]